jgi:hypothetical protein
MQVKKRKHFLPNLFCIYFCILFMVFFFCIFVFCFSISLPYLLHRLPLILLLFLISKFLFFTFFSLTSFLLIHLRVSNSHFATTRRRHLHRKRTTKSNKNHKILHNYFMSPELPQRQIISPQSVTQHLNISNTLRICPRTCQIQ